MSIEINSVASQITASPSAQVGARELEPRDTILAQTQTVTEVPPLDMGKNVEKAVQKLNELMTEIDRSLTFAVDKTTDKVVVQVVDSNTQEIVRQIPNEESLKLAEYIEGLVGIIFERNV